MNHKEKLIEIINNVIRCDKCGIVPEWLAEDLIFYGATVQEWISVKDRLPEENERVIAYRPNEPETSAYKYCIMWGWGVKTSLKHGGITHWCAMPQPPKGE